MVLVRLDLPRSRARREPVLAMAEDGEVGVRHLCSCSSLALIRSRRGLVLATSCATRTGTTTAVHGGSGGAGVGL